MEPVVPTIITGVIPLAATGLSAIFITDKLTKKQNALIALTAILVASIFCEWLSLTSGLPGDKAELFLGTLAYVAVFMKGDLGILYNSLLSVNSTTPINPNPVTSLGTRAYVPAGSTTPTTIPPRASAQQPE